MMSHWMWQTIAGVGLSIAVSILTRLRLLPAAGMFLAVWAAFMLGTLFGKQDAIQAAADRFPMAVKAGEQYTCTPG